MGKVDKLGAFEQRVLAAVVALGEDAFGLAIYDKLCEWEEDPNHGSMYVTLDRLEKKGYLISAYSLPMAERGGQPRKYFRAKPEGARVLRESLEMSKRVSDGIPDSMWTLIRGAIRIPTRFK